MKQLVVIVIIAHKQNLTPEEVASLKQCYKILGNYPVKLICPEGLDVSEYRAINENADIIFIDPKWQASYRMFNELKKGDLLYKKFSQYRYMLFYELDAWVFRDELEEWCKKGYDYIGAPWFKGFAETPSNYEIIGVGNGGFSLRNIDTSLRILKRIQLLCGIHRIWNKTRIRTLYDINKFISCFKLLFRLTGNRNIADLFSVQQMNEDYYWSQLMPGYFEDYKVAPVEAAIKFSFEVNPSILFKMNNDQLPFGCHAVQKYEPRFWDKYIHEKSADQ